MFPESLFFSTLSPAPGERKKTLATRLTKVNSLIKYLKTQSPHGYGYDYWRDKVLLLESFSNKIQVPNSAVAFQQRLKCY